MASVVLGWSPDKIRNLLLQYDGASLVNQILMFQGTVVSLSSKLKRYSS